VLLLVDPARQGNNEEPERVRQRRHEAQRSRSDEQTASPVTEMSVGPSDPAARHVIPEGRSNYWTLRRDSTNRGK
jgi:hypothetical protein